MNALWLNYCSKRFLADEHAQAFCVFFEFSCVFYARCCRGVGFSGVTRIVTYSLLIRTTLVGDLCSRLVHNVAVVLIILYRMIISFGQ